MKITFIGSGNMGKAIMGGIIKAGICRPDEITAADPSDAMRHAAAEAYGVNTKNDNVLAVKGADVVLLAVKPQVMAGVLEGIRDALTPDQLILSIAAGKTLAFLEEGLGSDKKIIRCMPNTPALVGEGMTEYAPGANVTEADKELARRILGSFGKCVELPEHLIDAAGAIAGCGPAYFYMMIEAMADDELYGKLASKLGEKALTWLE
jgi:pyrroline-5-carboxylate reductase